MTTFEGRRHGESGVRIRVPANLVLVLATLMAVGALGATVAIANTWLAAEGTWHAAKVLPAIASSGMVALGGRWSISVSAPVRLLARNEALPLVTGALRVPWNLLTAELLVLAAVAGARAEPYRPWVVAGVAAGLAGLLGVLSTHSVTALGGIPLAVPGRAERDLGVTITAHPNGGWTTALTIGLVGVAAGGARWCRERKVYPVARLAMAVILALGAAAIAAWVGILVASNDSALTRPLALTRADWFLGGPAWMVEGLGLGTGSFLRVQAHVLTWHTALAVGLFPGPSPARWIAGSLAVCIAAAVALAGGWYVRGARPPDRAVVWWLPLAYSALLTSWAAGSAFIFSGHLTRTVGVVGQLVSLLLRAVPLVGNVLARTADGATTHALRSGVGLTWGLGVWRACLGALVLSSVGTAAGVVFAPDGRVVAPARPTPPSVPVAGPTRRARRVCALCLTVTEGAESHCQHCGARL